MKTVKEFYTNQCHVYVYDTEYVFENKKIYCIKSVHDRGKKSGKENVRFGTLEQINGIIRTYRQVRVGGFIL